MKILVVDDNYDFRSTLIEYFQGKGYIVTGASNGKHALQLLEKMKCDIVLLDLEMPVMDGVEMLKRMKSLHGRLNFLVITGKVKPQKYFFYEMGCLHFEEKPIDIVELELKINNLFSLVRKKKRNEIPQDTIIELDINTIYDFIIQNIDDYNLNVDMITEQLYINKKQLYNRINDVLSISVHEMIKNIRLLKARELVYSGKVRTIKELSMKVGYSDSGYFTKLFKCAFQEDLMALIKKNSKKLDLNNFSSRRTDTTYS